MTRIILKNRTVLRQSPKKHPRREGHVVYTAIFPMPEVLVCIMVIE